MPQFYCIRTGIRLWLPYRCADVCGRLRPTAASTGTWGGYPHLQNQEALREKLLSLPDARETVGHGWYWENWLFATDFENTVEEAVDSAEWLNSQFHILAVRYTHKPTGFVFTNYRFRDKRAEAKSSGHDLLLYDWKDQ